MSRILAHKKALVGAALVLICLLIAAFVVLPRYVSCQLDRYASEAEITQISVREISLTRLRVDVTVRVENPNPIGATADRVAYDMYFRRGDDWLYLGSANRTEDVSIGSHEVMDVEVTHDISTISVYRGFKN
jgi:LEA14-like dessication related protein